MEKYKISLIYLFPNRQKISNPYIKNNNIPDTFGDIIIVISYGKIKDNAIYYKFLETNYKKIKFGRLWSHYNIHVYHKKSISTPSYGSRYRCGFLEVKLKFRTHSIYILSLEYPKLKSSDNCYHGLSDYCSRKRKKNRKNLIFIGGYFDNDINMDPNSITGIFNNLSPVDQKVKDKLIENSDPLYEFKKCAKLTDGQFSGFWQSINKNIIGSNHTPQENYEFVNDLAKHRLLVSQNTWKRHLCNYWCNHYKYVSLGKNKNGIFLELDVTN